MSFPKEAVRELTEHGLSARVDRVVLADDEEPDGRNDGSREVIVIPAIDPDTATATQ